MNEQNVNQYKFIIVGSSGVGKTSLLKRLVDNEFSEETISTIGVEFETVHLDVDGDKLGIQIWDTAGQERFRSISRAYFRNANGVLLVFDIKNKQTFDDINSWLKDIHALCEPDVSVLFIGNKSDLQESRLISLAEAESFSKLHNLKYMETSALSGINVRESFIKLASEIHRKKRNISNNINQGPTLTSINNNKKSNCC